MEGHVSWEDRFCIKIFAMGYMSFSYFFFIVEHVLPEDMCIG